VALFTGAFQVVSAHLSWAAQLNRSARPSPFFALLLDCVSLFGSYKNRAAGSNAVETEVVKSNIAAGPRREFRP
jgi:hypothetical protein